MAKVHVKDSFDAPADKVWAVVGDFGGVGKWAGDMVKSCECEGEGIGAVRTLALAQGNPLRERLVQFDAADRSFSYAIVGASDLPVDYYVGSVKIRADGANRSTIDWVGTFDAKGAPEAVAQEIVKGIYTGAIAAIKSVVAK